LTCTELEEGTDELLDAFQ